MKSSATISRVLCATKAYFLLQSINQNNLGVTIHFEGQLKKDSDFDKVMNVAKIFAQENNMDFKFFEEDNKLLERVKDEKSYDYQGKVKGIKIQPDINTDPLWLEFDKDNYIQDFCKTQFADLIIHIKIIELLRKIIPFFTELVVDDEGEFWETEDSEILQKHFDTFKCVFEEQILKNKKMSGPFRLEDGRIVDLMEDH